MDAKDCNVKPFFDRVVHISDCFYNTGPMGKIVIRDYQNAFFSHTTTKNSITLASFILYTLCCMLPVLVDLPFLKIYTYGVFLVLAFFWGTFLLWKNFLLTSYKEEEIFDCVFLSLAGGLLVSRIFYVAQHFDQFGFNVLKFMLINGYPGLTLYGFLVGFVLTLYLVMSVKKLKFTEAVDYFVPAAFLALGFGKVGAFFAGSEVGSKTNFLLRLKYVGADGMRHLTPLYEGIFFFAGAIIAYQLLFAIRRERFQKGTNFLFFSWYVALVYAVFDLLKASRVFIFDSLSFNALFSYILLLTLSSYFIYYFKSSIFQFINTYGKRFFKGFRKKAKKSHRC